MHIAQTHTDEASLPACGLPEDTDLLLVFGARALLAVRRAVFPALRARLSRCAVIAGCSTAGEICGTEVLDGSIVLTAVSFAATRVVHGGGAAWNWRRTAAQAGEVAVAPTAGRTPAPRAGAVGRPGRQRQRTGAGLARLAAVRRQRDRRIGRGRRRFRRDRGAGRCRRRPSHRIAAIGFYSEALHVGYGSLGGWDAFGPERRITRADGNVLYELDGESALEPVQDLPRQAGRRPALVRRCCSRWRCTCPAPTPTWCAPSSASTRQQQSMTFAGDLPVGAQRAADEGQFQPPGRRRHRRGRRHAVAAWTAARRSWRS
jgi:hypothetical protein